MAELRIEELEKYEELSISSECMERFIEAVEWLKLHGYRGEPKIMTTGPRTYMEAELVKVEKTGSEEAEHTFLFNGEVHMEGCWLKAMYSLKSRISIEYGGFFTGALAKHIESKRHLIRAEKDLSDLKKIKQILGG